MLASTFNRSTAAMLLALTIAAPAIAQQPPAPAPISAPHKAAAMDFLAASGGSNSFDGVVGQIVDEARVLLLQTNPDLSKQLTEAANVAKTAMANKTQEMLEAVALSLAAHFTEAELKELSTFYKSTVGKKFVAEQPLAMQEGFVNVQEIASRMQTESLEIIRNEMAKKGHKL